LPWQDLLCFIIAEMARIFKENGKKMRKGTPIPPVRTGDGR